MKKVENVIVQMEKLIEDEKDKTVKSLLQMTLISYLASQKQESNNK